MSSMLNSLDRRETWLSFNDMRPWSTTIWNSEAVRPLVLALSKAAVNSSMWFSDISNGHWDIFIKLQCFCIIYNVYIQTFESFLKDF